MYGCRKWTLQHILSCSCLASYYRSRELHLGLKSIIFPYKLLDTLITYFILLTGVPYYASLMVKLNMKLPALWFFYSFMRLQSLCLMMIVVFLSACQNLSLEGMLKLMKSNC